MFQKRVQKAGVPELLREFRGRITSLEPFTVESLETALNAFAAEKNVPAGDLIHALRLSTTGSAVGAGVYDCLVLLGREKSLERIDRSLAQVAA
jgi:glutamyl-tRNA synthetase